MSVRACPQARVASKVSPALWREIVVYFWLFLFAGLGGILLVSNWPEAIARLTVGFGAFTALFWKGRPLRARLWASGGFLLGAMPVVALAALERSLVWALLWAGTALLAVVLAWGFDLTVGSWVLVALWCGALGGLLTPLGWKGLSLLDWFAGPTALGVELIRWLGPVGAAAGVRWFRSAVGLFERRRANG